MLKPRTLMFAALALAAALAAGSAFAINAPADHESPGRGVSHLQEPDDDAPEAVQDPQDAKPKLDNAQLIADEFHVPLGDVQELRDEGIGWGALFKLYAIADAKGVSVDDLVASAQLDADGEREFAFGEMMQSLTDEQRAALEDHPRNFGHLHKAKKPKKNQD
jgi:hypothetical protein